MKLPFISDLMESARESLVTPALSLKLNGSAIEATGTTKPFGKSLEAQLNLKGGGSHLTLHVWPEFFRSCEPVNSL